MPKKKEEKEVLKKLEELTTQIKVKGFEKAFDDFFDWIDYDQWFYCNPSEPDDEDCVSAGF